MMVLLQVDQLAVEYSTEQGTLRALDSAALTIAAGETVGIVGESGSGKSTLALTIGRVLPSYAKHVAGDIAFEGRSVFAYSDSELQSFRRNELGYIFQNPVTALDPTMRVKNQLAHVLDTKSSDPVILSHLERVGLRDVGRVAKRFPHELSGGMAQRVVIAMAIARGPRLLIADEPTSSLDSTIREQILELLFSLPAQTGASLLLFTHDLRSVARFCDRMAVMYGGTVIEDGPGDKVFSHPIHPYTEALIKAAPGTEAIGGQIEAIPGRPPVLRERSEQCAFAPRCRWVVEVCWKHRPEAQTVDGRQVYCHRAEEVVSATASRQIEKTAMMPEAFISLRSVGVTFTSGPPWARERVDAVRAVDLDIHVGETVGLVGESGSGKTTLGRLCLGMQRPSRGQVLIDGSPFDGHRGRLRGHLQIVGQHPEWALNPRLRVGTSVGEPMAIMGIGTRAERQKRVGEMLELVGLESSLARRFPHQLSGVSARRVAIARSLITNPGFIVFDEVVSALDVSVQAQILNLIKEIQAVQDFAALFISHDLAAVRYVAHRVAVMLNGDILEIAPSERFYGQPEHPYSRELQAAIA